MCYVQPTYPTDLKFNEWQVVEPLLPKPEARGGRTSRPRQWPLCLIVNAIFYGCAADSSAAQIPAQCPLTLYMVESRPAKSRTHHSMRLDGRGLFHLRNPKTAREAQR